MKTFFKKYLPQLISLFVVLTPVFLFAGSSGATIQNPLGDENTSVQDLLLRILNLVAVVGGIVVVFMIIFSSVMIATCFSVLLVFFFFLKGRIVSGIGFLPNKVDFIGVITASNRPSSGFEATFEPGSAKL